jgi:hypothetical protein
LVLEKGGPGRSRFLTIMASATSTASDGGKENFEDWMGFLYFPDEVCNSLGCYVAKIRNIMMSIQIERKVLMK